MRTVLLVIGLCLSAAVASAADVAAKARVGSSPTNAANPNISPRPGPTNAVKYRPFHGVIKSYDPAAKAVVLRGEKAQTFLLIGETKIKKDGNAAGPEALAPGEPVGGRARQNAAGKWEALSRNICPASPVSFEPFAAVTSTRPSRTLT